MQGVDRKPLVCLDVVVSVARYCEGPHDETEQRRRAGADVYEGAENSEVFNAFKSFGTYEMNAPGTGEGVHEVAAVHGRLGEDIVEVEVHGRGTQQLVFG